MKRRFSSTTLACLLCAFAAAAHAQTPTSGKWVPPVKGEATLDFVQSKPTKVKGEIVTKVKVKNTSKGSIALLSIEELWYNTKREIATSGTARHRALLNPGEIVELTITSPDKPGLYTNMLMFRHANGTVKPNKVAKL